MPDRLSPRTTHRDLSRIAALVAEIAPAWDDVADSGARPFVKQENARGKGFDETDSTGAIAISGRHEALRSAARQAAESIERAVGELEAAATTLVNARLRTDPDEWIRATAKRQAALQSAR